ncbi:hypothetical protein E1301_Tti017268 [Triplophysa tibetana]|uniref:Uncharacterized protein n=1 Tax=Triplophysa tibetana TaxID=1572043 RepID=A0A5A9PAW9_9TELE|nr:hypothetical protein E1301_Tti017268 [Triplophysa tibetana]
MDEIRRQTRVWSNFKEWRWKGETHFKHIQIAAIPPSADVHMVMKTGHPPLFSAVTSWTKHSVPERVSIHTSVSGPDDDVTYSWRKR